MALETVNIMILDDATIPQEVDGVLVRVYDETGVTFIVEMVSGAVNPGEVEFILDGAVSGTVYQLRFYKIGIRVDSPQYAEVFSPFVPGDHDFDITIHDVLSLQTATDSSLCRLSGMVTDVSGFPVKNTRMKVRLTRHPVVVGSFLLVREREIQSDAEGILVADLYRGADYDVVLNGYEELTMCIHIPDKPAFSMFEVLLPYPKVLTFTPSTTVSLPAGSAVNTVAVSALMSDEQEIDSAYLGAYLDFSSSDETVAAVQTMADGHLSISGIKAGSAQILCAIRATTVDPRIVPAAISFTPLDVLVT